MLVDLPICRDWFGNAQLTYTVEDVAGAVIGGLEEVAMTETPAGSFRAVIPDVDTLNWPPAFIRYTDKNGLSEVVPLFVPANMAQANSTQIAISSSGASEQTVIRSEQTVIR